MKIKTKVSTIVTIINVTYGIRNNEKELKTIVLYSHALPTEPRRQPIGNCSLLRYIHLLWYKVPCAILYLYL